MKRYMSCPEVPDELTGNVACDNFGYCPYGQVCQQIIEDDPEEEA